MTDAQLRAECDRLRGVIQMYEAKAAAMSVLDHHHELRRRLERLEQRLEEGIGTNDHPQRPTF